MNADNSTVYILSSTGYPEGKKYYFLPPQNFHIVRTSKLSKSGVFESEDQAKHFLSEHKISARIWQIQPISLKTIFKARLEGI